MKRIIIVRHSKSSWENLSIDDYDRPLNDRGKKDAEWMSNVFRTKLPPIDHIISSGAKRAIETVSLMLQNQMNVFSFEIDDNLYIAEASAIENVISGINNVHSTILICGHNPGLTEFINEKTMHTIDDIPTSCFVMIEIEMKDWTEIYHQKGTIKFYEYPKMLKDIKHNLYL